jgi:hypothetical protein
MDQRMKKSAKAVALLLVFVVSQVYVQANLLGPARAHAAQAAATDQSPAGRLTTRGSEPVAVNGAAARSGQTIFSGQQIQTPTGTSATIQLGQLGRVELAPGSSVTLTFDATGIKVNLLSGCVILTANKGVAGTVETAGAEPQHTDSAGGSPLDVCTSKTPGGTPLIGQGAAAAAGAGAAAGGAATTAAAAAGGIFGMGAAGTTAFIAATAAVTGAAIYAANRPSCVPRGANPSPTVPRGPCQ